MFDDLYIRENPSDDIATRLGQALFDLGFEHIETNMNDQSITVESKDLGIRIIIRLEDI